jgi:hypothetical protein
MLAYGPESIGNLVSYNMITFFGLTIFFMTQGIWTWTLLGPSA